MLSVEATLGKTIQMTINGDESSILVKTKVGGTAKYGIQDATMLSLK